MKRWKFQKYHGTGNDFIMIDDWDREFSADSGTHIAHLCHRRFGIGADGLILLRPHEEHDFEMVYFNSDGQSSSMCGNGGRCIVKFAHRLGYIGGSSRFVAVDGLHEARIDKDQVHLRMGDVDMVKDEGDHYFIDTGSPHYVTWKENLEELDVEGEGRKIRFSPPYVDSGGCNVNFLEERDGEFHIRTYERGVEAETWSCGTGVTAAALAIYQGGRWKDKLVSLKTRGGQLDVSFREDKKGKYSHIYLIGPAEYVFEGEFQMD